MLILWQNGTQNVKLPIQETRNGESHGRVLKEDKKRKKKQRVQQSAKFIINILVFSSDSINDFQFRSKSEMNAFLESVLEALQ